MKQALTDEDTMPFGKYAKSGTKMRDVPASYFHWLWFNGKKQERDCPGCGAGGKRV